MAYVSPWLRQAREAIAAAVAKLPADASEVERLKAIDAAYPFGPRQYHPFKQWLKARREYIAGLQPKAPPPGGADWREKMRGLGYSFAGDDE